MLKPKHYPESLLETLRLNEVCGLNPGLDYSRLTADQRKGINFLFENVLTEREAMLIRDRYVDCMSKKKIAEKYGLRENHAYGIIIRSIMKLNDRELLFYVAEGYEARKKHLELCLEWQEQRYLRWIEDMRRSGLYFRNVENLNLPVRVTHALQHYEVSQIRELVVLSQYEEGIQRIRHLGDIAEEQIENALQKGGLLPKHYEKIWDKPSCINLDRELAAFQNLNIWFLREHEQKNAAPADSVADDNCADEEAEEDADSEKESNEDDGNSDSQ
ncbi:MAG: hypothetical protein LUE16_00065 [Lachnospiraceae bacterium]|nr:hypothetical protein [Lachnospiraceae bacterium]